MIIELKKFGTTLTSRDSGSEAYRAIKATLNNLKNEEEVILDFAGVSTFSPSWGDEFIVSIMRNHKNKVRLVKTGNKSVIASLDLLADINKIKFNFR